MTKITAKELRERHWKRLLLWYLGPEEERDGTEVSPTLLHIESDDQYATTFVVVSGEKTAISIARIFGTGVEYDNGYVDKINISVEAEWRMSVARDGDVLFTATASYVEPSEFRMIDSRKEMYNE